MKIELKPPFSEIWSKAYLREEKSTGRRRIDLINNSNDRTTISYARYLICIELGYILSEKFEVDHIDSNCNNDDIDNLQVLSVEEHRLKTSNENNTGRQISTLICPNCNKLFQKETRLTKNKINNFCSRSCNAKYNRQHNNWTGRQKIKDK